MSHFLSLNLFFFILKVLKKIIFSSLFFSLNYWKKKNLKFRDKNKILVKFKDQNNTLLIN